MPGVDIAAAKLSLRPGFSLRVLTGVGAAETLLGHLQWFYQQAHLSEEDTAVLL